MVARFIGAKTKEGFRLSHPQPGGSALACCGRSPGSGAQAPLIPRAREEGLEEGQGRGCPTPALAPEVSELCLVSVPPQPTVGAVLPPARLPRPGPHAATEGALPGPLLNFDYISLGLGRGSVQINQPSTKFFASLCWVLL